MLSGPPDSTSRSSGGHAKVARKSVEDLRMLLDEDHKKASHHTGAASRPMSQTSRPSRPMPPLQDTGCTSPQSPPRQLTVKTQDDVMPCMSYAETPFSGQTRDQVTLQPEEKALLDLMRKQEEDEAKKVAKFKTHFLAKGPGTSMRSFVDDVDGRRGSMVGLVTEGSRCLQPCRKRMYDIVSSPAFDGVMGFFVLLNMFAIGLESHYSLGEDPEPPMWPHIVEHGTRAIFILELFLRLLTYGKRALHSRWVMFDILMVLTSIVDWTLRLFLSGGPVSLDNFMSIRIIRLARLARVLRLMVQFKTLWLLVQGLLHSVQTLIWTLVLIGLLCFVFAILGLEIIPPQDLSTGGPYNAVATEAFGGLAKSMITLVKIMTFDDAGQIYRPLMLYGNWLLIVPYFASFMLIAGIALMNWVTALMVESANKQSREDREAQQAWETARKKTLIPKLHQMFRAIDSDGSGEIELGEIVDAPPELKDALSSIVHFDNIDDLFNILDYDQSGAIGIDEFLDGVMRAQGEKPIELNCLMKQCAQILREVRKVQAINGIEPSPSALPLTVSE